MAGVVRSRPLIAFSILVALSGCVIAHPGIVEPVRVPLEKIYLDSEAYDGKFVRVDACLSVIMEGMYLLDCGTRHPIINFETEETSISNGAVARLISFGHLNMGKAPEDIRVQVDGVYEAGKTPRQFEHTIRVRDFRPAPSRRDLPR